MKKLSIKAKAYDKAIESLRAAFYDGEEYRDACKRLIEPIFPELKESEDEKVRRELIKLLQECYDIDSGFFTRYCKVPFAQMLAWLEKQGEKGANGNEREIPNSVWSEEDERMITAIVTDLSFLEQKMEATGSFYREKNWLKSIKDRYTWKPSDEYIRTDAFVEKAFDAYCKVCGHYAHKTPTHICRQNCDYFENFKRYIKGE